MNYLRLFIFIFCCLSELWAYRNYSVDHPDVCLGVSKRTIKLGSGTQSALVIRHERHTDQRLMWNKGNMCTFDVRSMGFLGTLLDEQSGIFAVIQGMKLRRDLTTHECIDYIQFKDSKGRTSHPLCGDLHAMNAMDHKFSFDDDDDDDSNESDEASILTFDDPYGVLTVFIYIDNKQLLKPGEETDFKIAFTAYKHCRNNGYQMCDDDRSKCIYEGFFNDGVVNCPYYDCLDEHGCKPIMPLDVDKPLSIGSHVLIGSATSLVISFIVFGLCLYTCRKYGKLCWSEDFSRPPPNIRPPPVVTSNSSQVAVAESANLHTPSAPPPNHDDKDMPPSYESLFPQPNSR